MDAYVPPILVALLGFLALAVIVLLPFYLFLQREKKASEQWTAEALARRPGVPLGVIYLEERPTLEDRQMELRKKARSRTAAAMVDSYAV